MPRQKKQAAEPVVAPVKEVQSLSYMGMPAIITHTHEDGHLDIAVDYNGKIVPKFRVSPEAIEYKNAP